MLYLKGCEDEAIATLINLSECSEIGLGVSKTRKGLKIGNNQAIEILNLFRNIPEFNNFGLIHFELIQLYISGISKDRISDISYNYIKSFLINYTIEIISLIQTKNYICLLTQKRRHH